MLESYFHVEMRILKALEVIREEFFTNLKVAVTYNVSIKTLQRR